MHVSEELAQRIARLKVLILDVDGVMTDGGLIIGDDGQEYKRFHARDGLGLKMLSASGIEIAIITARTSNVVKTRAEDLAIKHLYQGRKQKLPAYQELCATLSLDTEETAFMGDDVVDLPIMTRCGIALSVADGHPLVHQHSHWISRVRGGNGAIREACELIMYCQGTLDAQLQQYLNPESPGTGS